jgi:aryl-alcohol dehydrogenase-like predicted oxidoreductase
MSLSHYHLLGRTGLRVSPLALGAMTFGNHTKGWGADKDASRSIFHRYVEAGGNFVDTANAYGDSEKLLGEFLAETGWRDQLVLATKFTGARRPGDPNALGNGRKNILASLEASLRRLQTDYVDLYWLHVWDRLTPVEEVMSTLDALVRSGKVRAIGLSDVPAWYATKAQLLARTYGWEPVAALQLPYSLVERGIEREHAAAALDLGMGVVPWSALANGFLSGKYTLGTDGVTGQGRLKAVIDAGWSQDPSQRGWAVVLQTLVAVADQLGRSPAQVALNWVTHQPGVVATLVGARSIEQLDENLAALDFVLSDEHAERLEQASRPVPRFPFDVAYGLVPEGSEPDVEVRARPAWHDQ